MVHLLSTLKTMVPTLYLKARYQTIIMGKISHYYSLSNFDLDGSYSLIIDQSVSIGQLAVAHRHQLLLFRTSK